MSDKQQLVTCPSCGHQNSYNVDTCAICDFALKQFMNESQTRPIDQTQRSTIQSNAPTGKQLGPLPDSDLLIDKQKGKLKKSKIKQCPDCGEMNHIGTYLCTNCGARLQDSSTLVKPIQVSEVKDTSDEMPAIEEEHDTVSVNDVELNMNRSVESPAIQIPQLLEEPVDEIPDGCPKFMSWMILQLDVVGFDTPIVIRPLDEKPVMIGRRHQSLPVQPHIDLSPYLTEHHGVSRRHAVLRLRGTRLEILDLNSTNGTSINGVRFSPQENHQLRHQDMLCLGQVQMRVSFIQQVRSAKLGHTEELG